MRALLAASLLTLLPATFAAAGPASAQARGSVYLSLMGEPFVAPAGQSGLALWIAQADTNKDGSLSLAEVNADAERFFKRLDVDKDGRIGGFEMTIYEEEVAPAKLRAAAGLRPVGSDRPLEKDAQGFIDHTQRTGRGMLPGGMKGAELSMTGEPLSSSSSGASMAIPQPVAMTDVDLSGSVTAEEFARAAARRFATLDTNKNGLLEQHELTARGR